MQRSIGLLVALVGIFTLAGPVHAQTASASGDISGAYSSLTDVTADSSSEGAYSGWLISGSWRLFGERLFLAGEVGSNSRRNVVDETSRVTGYLAGARYLFWRTSRFAAFAQGQFGVERFSEPGFAESGPAIQPGVGFDVGLTSIFGVRVQSDFRFANQSDTSYQEVRFSVGGVINLRR